MTGQFTDIAFTPHVKTMQRRYGSRAFNRERELSSSPGAELTAREIAFLEQRNNFHMATVSENGWPYVQFRGGPAGFVKILDPTLMGFADFRGNRQYLSTGNLMGNNRISLIFIDYESRTRLKLWGRALIVHKDDQPDRVRQLEMPAYRAKVERGILIRIDAFDWNCPQHIPMMLPPDQVDALLRPLLAENESLRQKLASAGLAI